MSSRRSFTLLLGLAAILASPATGQETVARVKSAPQDYRDRTIQLQGEVVELRGISPRTTRGVYRLVDESDPGGVLIRTRRLPESGGPFRVEARLSPELLQGGLLLLDEIDRDRDQSPLLPVAIVLAGLGLLSGLVALLVYFKTKQTERHLRLGPPMWLIPTAQEETAETPGGEPPPIHFNYRLHYIEEEKSARVDRRKRRSVLTAAVSGVIGVAAIGWFFALRRADAEKPSFVLVTPDGGPAAPVRDTVTRADSALPAPPADTAIRVAVTPPSPADSLPPAVRDSLRRRRAAWRDSVRQAREAAAAAATAAATIPKKDTAPPQVVTVAPVVEQQPPPPPPPVIAPRETTAVEVKPRPDPEALRRAGMRELDSGIQRFAAAVIARQAGTVGALYPATGDVKRRERFLDFLRTVASTATYRGSDPPTVSETSGETSFTIAFRWRGDFGVDRRKDVRFAASARRSGEGWTFEGARLLEAFP